MTIHVLLDTASERSIRALRRDGSSHGAHTAFHLPIGLMLDHISDGQTRRSFRSRFLDGCVVGQIPEMEPMGDLGDLR